MIFEMTLQAVKGIPAALEMTALTLLLSIPLAFAAAVIRSGERHRIWKVILNTYISFERGCPAIVQILMFYTILRTSLDLLFIKLGLSLRASNVNKLYFAVTIFILIETAILSETFRSGLKALNKGQYEAAVSNGLTGFQAYLRVVIPQVIEITLPVLCTDINALIKMTSLCFAMTIQEITAYPKVLAGRTLAYLDAYVGMAIVYFILCMTIEFTFKLLESRVQRRYHKAGGQQEKELGGTELC